MSTAEHDAPEANKTVLQRGLWFEEFQIGTAYLHRPGRTVTEADNVLFTTLTMNTQSLHLFGRQRFGRGVGLCD